MCLSHYIPVFYATFTALMQIAAADRGSHHFSLMTAIICMCSHQGKMVRNSVSSSYMHEGSEGCKDTDDICQR